MKAQRLRFRCRVTAAAGGLGNRDLVRAWETAMTQAGFSLAYSEGRRRSPQISLAAPLPMGVNSDCELIDVYLDACAAADAVLKAVATHLPNGVEPFAVTELGVDGPSLQSQLRWAEYEAVFPAGAVDISNLSQRIDDLLSADTLPSEYIRADKVKSYDLRPLILAIELEERGQDLLLRMRLLAEQDRTARADQVLLALGIDQEARIHRTRLEVDEVPAVLQAYRRAGEPATSQM